MRPMGPDTLWSGFREAECSGAVGDFHDGLLLSKKLRCACQFGGVYARGEVKRGYREAVSGIPDGLQQEPWQFVNDRRGCPTSFGLCRITGLSEPSLASRLGAYGLSLCGWAGVYGHGSQPMPQFWGGRTPHLF